MLRQITVLDADEKQGQEFCGLLEKTGHFSQFCSSLVRLEECLETMECLALFIDVDTVAITNVEIRDLSLKYPHIFLFCLSKRRFHPELKDAICYHVYACLNRPVDPDELRYWLRIISKEEGSKE
ncbi:MAG: hypothetical protein C4530_02975 [Desulfobacteraceae bacterium]|nr:MAG: hypothetical protein C4530_02975 [Desulfobacteraceae bacterium]